MSPELSVHECLYALGDVALGQVRIECSGDLARARKCVLGFVHDGWARLFHRSADKSVTELAEDDCRWRLEDGKAWEDNDSSTAPFFMRITHSGRQAFEQSSSFQAELERGPHKIE